MLSPHSCLLMNPVFSHVALSVMPCCASCFQRCVYEYKEFFLPNNHFHVCVSYHTLLKQIMGTFENTNYLPASFTCETILSLCREPNRFCVFPMELIIVSRNLKTITKTPTLPPTSYQKLGLEICCEKANLQL